MFGHALCADSCRESHSSVFGTLVWVGRSRRGPEQLGASLEQRAFREGDKVEWNSHGSTVEGEVVEVITSDTE